MTDQTRNAPVPTKPKFKFPANSCDCHCHIFGPPDRFPFQNEGGGDTFIASKEDLRRAHDILGIERVVVVHANSHGTDMSATLDAIADSPSQYRGVALVDDDISDKELADLHAGGIRGVRYGFAARHGGRPSDDRLHRMADRISEFGWHIVFLLEDGDLAENRDLFQNLPVPIVLDHMARLPAQKGVSQPGFTVLTDLLKRDDIWVKVSGVTRVSEPPYTDAVPLAAGIIEAAPDRVIWGTDWPHPNPGPHGPPDDGPLVDLMSGFTSDETLRHKFLVENPAALYGFE